MDTLTLGVFHTQEYAENAIAELSLNGFSLQDIFIVMKDQGIASKVCEITGAQLANGEISGSAYADGVKNGDLLGGLIELGLPEVEVRIYEQHLQTGAILIGVPISDQSENVRQILEKNKASQIRLINRNSKKI